MNILKKIGGGIYKFFSANDKDKIYYTLDSNVLDDRENPAVYGSGKVHIKHPYRNDPYIRKQLNHDDYIKKRRFFIASIIYIIFLLISIFSIIALPILFTIIFESITLASLSFLAYSYFKM
jgi:hypothetical protein